MEEGEQGKFSTGEGERGEVPVVTDSREWWETQIRACVQKKTQAPRSKIVFCAPGLLSSFTYNRRQDIIRESSNALRLYTSIVGTC